MKGMTFENFRVDSGNRAAYDLCRRAATLTHESALPAVLLGPEGSGKTHLLWSIVKHVRASGGRAGLVLVMASEFPEQVQQLAVNPAPLQDGKPTLLLVDDLDDFAGEAYTLEGVVKAFLANGHGVILASAVHPDRLLQFSAPFRALLLGGDILEIDPAGPLLDEEEAELALTEALRAERDALEQKLAHKASESAELAQVRVRLDEAMRQVEQLTLALADTSRFDVIHERHQAELAAAGAEREEYKLALAALHEERDALERRLAERTAAAAEADMLRERLLALEHGDMAARAELEREVERLRGELNAMRVQAADDTARASEEIVGLRAQLSQAQESAERANEAHVANLDRIEKFQAQNLHLQAELSEYRGGLEEARELRKELDEARRAARATGLQQAGAAEAVAAIAQAFAAERAAAEVETAALRAELRALVEAANARGPINLHELARMREGLQDAQSLSAAFRLQMDQDRQAYEAELSQLRSESAELQALAEKAMAEQARAGASGEAQRARLRGLEFELEKERKQNALLIAEMEALRNEAAVQVAQANLQAGEMEGRLARLREALDLALLRGRSAAHHAEALGAAFAQASEALDKARADLMALDTASLDAEVPPGSDGPAQQPSLFDTAPFMRELAALPGPGAFASTLDAPRPMLDLVEQALGGDGDPRT